jgi:hypothetical protein
VFDQPTAQKYNVLHQVIDLSFSHQITLTSSAVVRHTKCDTRCDHLAVQALHISHHEYGTPISHLDIVCQRQGAREQPD